MVYTTFAFNGSRQEDTHPTYGSMDGIGNPLIFILSRANVDKIYLFIRSCITAVKVKGKGITLGLLFNGLHLRNPCNDYYSFTDPRGMEG